jgi:glycine cleavage system H protein
MNIIQSTPKDLYYTKDHEWIDFQRNVAYIGICKFKLTGFKQIQSINFKEALGFMKQGEAIATVVYNDYTIGVHMPVDGKILQINNALIENNLNLLIDCCESSAWLALIEASDPHDRSNLLLPKEYKLNGKGKYTK